MVNNRVIRNTLSMFTGQSGAHALALLFNFYLGKMLPDGDFGLLQFAIAYVVVFMVLAEYGLQTLLVRDIARDKSHANAYFWNSIILKTVLSVIAACIGWIVLTGFYAGSPEKQLLVYLVAGSMLFNAWYFSIAAVFIGHQENHIEAALFFIGKLVYVACGATAVFLFRDVRIVAVVFTGAAGVQFVLAFICLLLRHRHFRFTCDVQIIRHLVTKGWMFFSITLFTTLHLKFDYIFIGYWCPNADLGHYAGAYNLVLAPIILANAFVRSMYPALAECRERGDALFWQQVQLGFRWLAVLAFPVLFFMTIDGGRILAFVYKRSFVAALLPMQILLWGQGLDFFCPFAGHILYVLDRQKQVIIITGLSVLTNILADIILIPLYGTVGASIAMVISLSVMFWGYALALHRWLPVARFLRQLIPPLCIAAVCAPLAWWARHYVPFWINGPAYWIICLALYFGFKLIRMQDLKMFSSDYSEV
jgi:O-antigen/teichoic acid export membrane protein